MSYVELENIIFKVWLNTNDIRKLANNCCRDTAIKIRNNVAKEITDNGYELVDSKEKVVPAKTLLNI